MSSLLIGAAVAAACSVGCGLMRGRQRGRLQAIQAIRSVTVEELQELQQGVAKEIGAGSYKEVVKLQADLVCDQPLITPFSNEPCIAYQSRVVEIFEERVMTTDSQGKSTTSWQRNERLISSEECRCGFSVQQGNLLLDVDPEGAEIDLVEILNRLDSGQLVPGRPSAGWSGASASALQLGPAALAGNLNRAGGPSFRLIGYRQEESIFQASGSVFVVAEVSDSAGSLSLRQPQDGGLFLIRHGGEERLLKRLQTSIQLWTISLMALLVIAVVSLIWALLGHRDWVLMFACSHPAQLGTLGIGHDQHPSLRCRRPWLAWAWHGQIAFFCVLNWADLLRLDKGTLPLSFYGSRCQSLICG
jgi:hypothetical protein